MGETGELLNSDMSHNPDYCSEAYTNSDMRTFMYTLEHLNSIKSPFLPVHPEITILGL